MQATLSPPTTAELPASPCTDGRRYTIDGDPGLESLIEEVCTRVRLEIQAAVPARDLEGVLLGGGYGRGEGGVLRGPRGDRPYNDLEFYVGIRGHPRLNERRYAPVLQDTSRGIGALAGVDVDFKIISLAALPQMPITMFSYDLVCGHRHVAGGRSWVSRAGRHQDPARIPDAEAARLLLNRMTGLLLARGRLEAGSLDADDADFVGRNLAKARLGIGDAVLTAHGRYNWSCRARGRGLESLSDAVDLPWLGAVRREHAAGIDFKLHPVRRSTGEIRVLSRELAELVALGRKIWLWLESRRLGSPFATIRDYAFSDADKSPTIPRLHNLKANARVFGPLALLRRASLRYPRDRLMESLALLLWEPSPANDEVVLRRLQSRLSTRATEEAGLLAAYRSLWAEFR